MYRSKREVLSTIKEHKFTKGGKEYTIFSAFLGKNPRTKKIVRVARSDEDELKQYVTDYYKKLESGGESAAELDHAQAEDAVQALALIGQHNLGMSLVECVRAVIDGTARSASKCTTTVAAAWEMYLPTLDAKSERHRKTVRSRVGTWVSKVGTEALLSDVTAAGVKKYLMENIYKAEKPDTATTYNKVLGDIHTFMRWCASKEQDLVEADPLDGMKKMDIAYQQPEYSKAADVEKLFRVLEANKARRPQDLADAILSFFCGVRQCEIERVREGESAVKISLEDHFIRVVKVKGSSRGIRPRAFKIPDQAEAWMRSFDFMAAVRIPNAAFRYHLTMAAKKAGIDLPENAGRHTFITMYEAAHHDTNALSGIVGNTDAVRSQSYNGVELEREGRAYFEIMPTSSAS